MFFIFLIIEQWLYYFIAYALKLFRNFLAAAVRKMNIIKKMGKVSLYIPLFCCLFHSFC